MEEEGGAQGATSISVVLGQVGDQDLAGGTGRLHRCDEIDLRVKHKSDGLRLAKRSLVRLVHSPGGEGEEV